jgi:hypothetical protein
MSPKHKLVSFEPDLPAKETATCEKVKLVDSKVLPKVGL